MSAQSPTSDGDDPLATLVTVRDWLRYAVSRFQQAGLVYGHGTTTALDEAAFLILHTLHLPIDTLEPFLDARLLPGERAAVRDIVEARVATRKPAPYLTHEAWVGGHAFYVDEHVIVPRSYLAELLADGGAGLLPTLAAFSHGEDFAPTRILDMCTGSGCLAILAALAWPDVRVDAVDISADALAVAARNVADYGLADRIELLRGDLLAPVAGRRYDLILTNPPYVDDAGMAALPPEYGHEPALALASGPDGTEHIARILARAGAHLEPQGVLVAEIGRCRPALEAAFPTLPFLWLETETTADEVFALHAADLDSATPARKRRK